MKFTITAGHGAGDPGAVAKSGETEAALMTELRDIVAVKLRLMGHQVKTDGARWQNLPLVHALTLVPGSDVAIELHTNAFTTPSAGGGGFPGGHGRHRAAHCSDAEGAAVIPLTAAQVQRATGSTLANAELYLPFLQGACKAFDITSPKRLAGFLSQIGHESGGMSTLEESLNYSVEGLQRFVRWGRISEADAQQYGRRRGQPANQQMIANLIYGGTWGKRNLGNEYPTDGWTFRGRGLKQLTGRSNYLRCGDAIGEKLTLWPERLLLPVNAALSAAWFWDANGLNDLADKGDVPAMTKLINGGDLGLKERTALWHTGLEVFA